MTPSDHADKFSFSSPPAVQKLPEIPGKGTASVKFYLRASTTARRSIAFRCLFH
jgi:hypothetical protein